MRFISKDIRILFTIKRQMSTAPTSHTSRDPVLDVTESRFLELKASFNSVTDAISGEIKALSHDRGSVELVAVSKYMPASDIQALYDLGQRHFGENYVQELTQKAEIVRLISFATFNILI